MLGGDYYYQLGNIYHFIQGGGFMQSSSLTDSLPTYSPGYSYIVGSFANLFSMDALTSMFTISIISTIISILLWYKVLDKLFEKNLIVLIFGLIFIAFKSSIILKYTNFALAIHLPLFILTLYNFMLTRKKVDALFLGVVYGLSALTYIIMFVGATLILLQFLILEIIQSYRNRELKIYFEKNIILFSIILLVSIPLAFIYWFEPVFVHQLHSYYNRAKLDFPNFGLANVQTDFVINTFVSVFFNFKSIMASVFTILHLIGFIYLFIDKSFLSRFILKYFIASLLLGFSFFITEPLLDTNFIPPRLNLFFLNSSVFLLTLFAIYHIILFKFKEEKFNIAKYIFIVVLIIIFAIVKYDSFENKKNSKWYKKGQNPINPIYNDVGKYLRENSTVDDVVLTTKELGFALNSVSGIKLISGRWAHNGSPYTDLSQRDLDVALLLYGNNLTKRDKLIQDYGVKYLFWSYYWVGSEFTFDKKGKLINTFDPLIVFDKEKYISQLLENQVFYFRNRYWLDPSVRKKDVNKYDIAVISPKNYRNSRKPWAQDMNKRLKKVWSYKNGNQELAVLYEIVK
jgi:hypothetical protein